MAHYIDKFLGLDTDIEDDIIQRLLLDYDKISKSLCVSILDEYRNFLSKSGFTKSHAVLILYYYSRRLSQIPYFRKSLLVSNLFAKYINIMVSLNVLRGSRFLEPLNAKSEDDFLWVTFKFFQNLRNKLRNLSTNPFRIKLKKLALSNNLDPEEVVMYYSKYGGSTALPSTIRHFIYLAGYTL
jgi:hypothetical protein